MALLIGQNVQSTKVPTELLAGTFTGEKLVGMGSVDKERTIAIVTYNPTSSKFYLLSHTPWLLYN